MNSRLRRGEAHEQGTNGERREQRQGGTARAATEDVGIVHDAAPSQGLFLESDTAWRLPVPRLSLRRHNGASLRRSSDRAFELREQPDESPRFAGLRAAESLVHR